MAERVFNLPDLGEGLEDAEIVTWKVAEGDAAELNQPLVDVNTAKALVEIPSPFEGTVLKLHGAEGDVIEVGSPLVTFEVAEDGAPVEEASGPDEAKAPEAEQEEKPKREAVLVGYGVDQAKRGRRRRLRPPGQPPPPPQEASAPAPEAPAPMAAPAPAAPPHPGKVRASPVVRRLAREHGIDLSTVSGSGPGGRIRREDLQRLIEGDGTAPAPAVPAGSEERVPIRGIRRLIFQKMAKAWAEVPHVTSYRTIDATWVEALRRELTDDAVKVSPLPVVVRALVEVCRQHPKLNASYDPETDEIVLKGSYHVGIATDTERGLIVPVVRDADRKGIRQIAREIAGIVQAARAGTATPDQLTGSTITITNVGTFGSEYGTPIINIPEVAILALGAIRERPWVVDGELEPRPVVTLSLSFDHRIIDGAEAGRAMTDLAAILESPFRLGALPR